MGANTREGAFPLVKGMFNGLVAEDVAGVAFCICDMKCEILATERLSRVVPKRTRASITMLLVGISSAKSVCNAIEEMFVQWNGKELQSTRPISRSKRRSL